MVGANRFPWEHDGETLTLATPEQTRLELAIAPFATRVVAALIDRVLIAVVVLVLAAFAFLWNAHELAGISAGYVMAGCVVTWFLLGTTYAVFAELRNHGRTFGKRRMGLRTVMESGGGVTVSASLVRNLARIVDEIPILWLVPAVSRRSRRVGDLLAGTVVVVVERPAARRHVPVLVVGDEPMFTFGSQAVAALRVEDLDLLEYLDQQLADTPRERRRAFASAVAEKYVARLQLDADRERALAEPFRFLGELAAFLRKRFEARAY